MSGRDDFAARSFDRSEEHRLGLTNERSLFWPSGRRQHAATNRRTQRQAKSNHRWTRKGSHRWLRLCRTRKTSSTRLASNSPLSNALKKKERPPPWSRSSTKRRASKRASSDSARSKPVASPHPAETSFLKQQIQQVNHDKFKTNQNV